jgi:hypothetical protein
MRVKDHTRLWELVGLVHKLQGRILQTQLSLEQLFDDTALPFLCVSNIPPADQFHLDGDEDWNYIGREESGELL